jgi:hypothetical protein
MDETPIKAGRAEKGKLHQGYFWSLYGDKDEVEYMRRLYSTWSHTA